MAVFDESILTSVKKVLGIPEYYEHFDQDILLHLNSVMSILHQLGVGPENGFVVEDDSTKWSDLFDGDIDTNKMMYVKSYVCLRVRLLFDPPASSGAIDAMERQMRELEWRITVTRDPRDDSEEVTVNDG
mgnify:CR=1 FL=1